MAVVVALVAEELSGTKMKLDVNMSTIWTMLVGTVMAVAYMFTTFATASDLQELAVDIYYDQYYDLRDSIRALDEDEDEDYLRELERRLERIKAKICMVEPEWERCDGPIE